MTESSPFALHTYLAKIMDERLRLLKRTPQKISIIGNDGGQSFHLLHIRYPQARIDEYHHESSPMQKTQKWWQKWQNKTQRNIHHLSFKKSLPLAAVEMLWVNLSLVHFQETTSAFEKWSNHLQRDGMLFFSHLGRDSFLEVRQILAENEIEFQTPQLHDMHDLGDMLFHHGFYDPVMDTAQIILDYQDFATLQHDFKILSLWKYVQVKDSTVAEGILQEAWQQGKLKQLTLETVLGHALNRLRLPENEKEIQFFQSK